MGHARRLERTGRNPRQAKALKHQGESPIMSTTETNDHAAPPVETPYSKASYRYFVLGVLTLSTPSTSSTGNCS